MKKSILLSTVIGLIATVAQAQCTAYFSVAQAITPARGPVPWHIQVTDSSTSLNTPLTYHWDFGDGTTTNAQNPIHQYAGSGPYLLCLYVTAPAGSGIAACTSAVFCDTIKVDSNGHLKSAQGITLQIGDGSDGEVSTPTGINTIAQQAIEFDVYPNPAGSLTRVMLNADENGYVNLELYNIKGQRVWSTREVMRLGGNIYEVDLSAFDSGLYLLKLMANDNTASTTIIRE